jgi:anti-sigma regulatory factor (Ser/Thr protein kinase)
VARGKAGSEERDFRLEVPQFVTMAVVHNLVDRAQPILQAGGPRFGKFTVDASGLAHISPVGLTALTSIVLFARHHNLYRRGVLIYPRKTHVRTYLSRMNFTRLLGVRRPANEAHRAPRRARFRELVQVETSEDCPRVTNQLRSVLVKTGEVSDVVLNNAVHCLLELLENVVHHADSPTKGVACAQSYKNHVEVAIADCGIGIRRSLAKNPAHRGRVDSDEAAVRLALQKGITSTPDRNSGEGLFFVAELMLRAGRIKVCSGEATLLAGRNGIGIKQRAVWPGTLIGLRFERNSQVPIREIFDRFSPMTEQMLPFEEV